ncbi:hypothetical protein [Pedobacter cryotolerans]|uniref:Uncharacterized protein n=1 Tax=Pedobacter cryotolerans TaxID=2571270 RepID=A0A4U1BVE4_9SPHI|nr:hypothetical protein [Pedobacter cryotolerans]TKB96113.1 hypothetical protein FA045_18750 [Pedobacter cryotolerans]
MQNTSEEPLVPNSVLNYNDLTYMQKQKYDYLKTLMIDEQLTLKVVTLIEGRGKNNFDSVVEKIELLNNAKQSEQRYHDALYDNFVIDTIYSSSGIMGIVSEVRREVGLKPYSSRWKQNCENDFFTLFIVHEVYQEIEIDGKVKKQLVGYKPVFKLKLED